MKGITPVIATIMLLLITISLVGFAFTWFSTIWQSVAKSTENATETQIMTLGQKVVIDNAASKVIVIRNVGTYNIPWLSMSVYINNAYKNVRYPAAAAQDCNWSSSEVAPGGTIGIDCNCTIGDEIKVTAPGNIDIQLCE